MDSVKMQTEKSLDLLLEHLISNKHGTSWER